MMKKKPLLYKSWWMETRENDDLSESDGENYAMVEK